MHWVNDIMKSWKRVVWCRVSMNIQYKFQWNESYKYYGYLLKFRILYINHDFSRTITVDFVPQTSTMKFVAFTLLFVAVAFSTADASLVGKRRKYSLTILEVLGLVIHWFFIHKANCMESPIYYLLWTLLLKA